MEGRQAGKLEKAEERKGKSETEFCMGHIGQNGQCRG